MSKLIRTKPLGEILKNAGLISEPQIAVALNDQNCYQDMRFGEILALRGWIDANTADFFVEEWWDLINNEKKYPLGFYLKKAGLLTEEQINLVLKEQHNTLLRFGTTAVLKGLLKQETVDFFLNNLFPEQVSKRNVAPTTFGQKFPKNTNREIITREKLVSEEIAINQDRITKDDITHWVVLSTQKITNL
ncbi:MAG: hypothetical protein ACFCU5_00595 [Pleurocapsa sp.]